MSYLFVHEDREYLLDPGERFESDLGILEVPEDVEPGDVVETHLGTGFTVRRLRGPDLFNHLERTGAPMMPRDVGLVVGKTGVAAGDRVLDAGTGTGILSAYMGRLGADVVTYEIDPEFAEVARENMAVAGVEDAVEVRTGDVTDDLDELSGFDVVTLDTEDAPTVVERTPTLLDRGGSLAVYSPFVENTREVVVAATEVGLDNVETLDTIQREMDFDDRGSRPSTGGVGHTGYLTFARRP
ncbi:MULTISPECIES: methyltransferase domain-containing protein [Haloarcula]|uniref:SAM-dependent methyltransferase n=1 Tax=Haloarcula pellucida TaxID=1427151 RepID=A0A830GI73_9EURY|nr:methyltransferase domain-containing protein [Halomicroarcula pellucida]MBX0346844.1 methyltransferase domain-containing protein [Halomicroarcula pellucida]QIO22308.1 methyltransferase domain-containing protein [Haloarcula sp. JP-L23]GGN85729.1 SAM-dependent methyltransferase [Halomicroarcula pellucida]